MNYTKFLTFVDRISQDWSNLVTILGKNTRKIPLSNKKDSAVYDCLSSRYVNFMFEGERLCGVSVKYVLILVNTKVVIFGIFT
jgi:hypothetical protein